MSCDSDKDANDRISKPAEMPRRTFIAGCAGGLARMAACITPAKIHVPELTDANMTFASAKTLAAAIRTKRLSSLEAVEAHLARIAAVNPKLNALVYPIADAARASAREADCTRAVIPKSAAYFDYPSKDHARALKRGGGCTIASLDAAHGENQFNLASDTRLSPGQLYDRFWALTLLHRAMHRLEDESSGTCKPEVFERQIRYLAPAGDDVPYRETAAQLNMSETAVKAAVYRLRKRDRALLKDEIARTVATENQVEEEIQFLFAALSI